ncbi:hypothetical protein [Actinomadura sp. 9N215]|uniref:hypothetical protein n=1 Tax=Actinomadura sp. 9N215 TaxID=3375150 RepID=UPI0037B05B2A
MPKHQSTAAKAARQQARDGAKYTQALRDGHSDGRGDNERPEAAGDQPRKVTRQAAREALAGLVADPALMSPWRPVLSRLADDAAGYDAASEVVRAFEECDNDEFGLPVGVSDRQARERRYLALCAYGARAVAVLRAVADHRPPGPGRRGWTARTSPATRCTASSCCPMRTRSPSPRAC